MKGLFFWFLFLLLIDSLGCCPFLRMAVVISLVLVLQQKTHHSTKKLPFAYLRWWKGYLSRTRNNIS